MKLSEWQTRGFRDLDGEPPAGIDWSDAVERAAITACWLKFNTPEAVVSAAGSAAGRSDMDKTWTGMDAVDRQFQRRRAAVVLSIGLREPTGA